MNAQFLAECGTELLQLSKAHTCFLLYAGSGYTHDELMTLCRQFDRHLDQHDIDELNYDGPHKFYVSTLLGFGFMIQEDDRFVLTEMGHEALSNVDSL